MSDHKSKLHRARSILVNVVLIGAVFLAVLAFQSRNMLSADGDLAPGLRGVTLSGEPYDLDNVGERPALVYFFAPWCPICAASAGNLNRLRRWRAEDAIEIVAVALDWQTLDEVRHYAERHELKVTVVLGAPDVGRQWRIQAYPSYYVLDSEHRIVRRDVGYSTQLGLWLRAWLIQATDPAGGGAVEAAIHGSSAPMDRHGSADRSRWRGGLPAATAQAVRFSTRHPTDMIP